MTFEETKPRVNPLTTAGVEVETRDGVVFVFIGSQVTPNASFAQGNCLLI
jgi:hypothetical protein